MHLPLILHHWRWSCFILENYLKKKGLLMLSFLLLFFHAISLLWTKIESRLLRAGLTFYLQAHHHQIKLKSRVPLTEEPPCWQLFKQTCPIFIIITLGAKKKGKKRKEPHPSLNWKSFSLGSISNEWNVTSVLPPYEKRHRHCVSHLLLRYQLKNRGGGNGI